MLLGKPRIHLEDFQDMLNFESEQEEVSSPTFGQSGVVELKFDNMEDFPNHKFKQYVGKQFEDMVESIRQFGILQPLILWHTKEGKNIILSGHNRKNCAKAAGLTSSPVILKDNLTYEDAVLIVMETNLRQRSFHDMSPSERAYCLFEHYKAMKSQGRRTDLLEEIERWMNPQKSEVFTTSAEISRSCGNREKLAKQYDLTEDMLAKYIRIGEYLDLPLMEKFEEEQISISVANTLSFVTDKEKQGMIAELMERENYRIDGQKAELLRRYYEAGKLTDVVMMQILSGEKTKKLKKNKPQPFPVKSAVITKYFNAGQTKKEIEETIEKALDLYFESRSGEREVTT